MDLERCMTTITVEIAHANTALGLWNPQDLRCTLLCQRLRFSENQMTDDKVTGRCLCGAVRYEIDEPTDVWYCHCESCRRNTGAPITAWALTPIESVTWSAGKQARHESSTGVFRGFCRDCGTPLSYETLYEGQSIICFLTGTLDHPDRHPPTRHVFHAEHIAWFNMNDDLPR
jgi:hypothetical protein